MKMNHTDFLMRTLSFLCLAALSSLMSVYAQGAGSNPASSIARLQRDERGTQLIVDGKPFLMLAGELGNSSASNLDYLKPFWPKFVRMNLNTLLVPVYWELIESQEGTYDFRILDSIVHAARECKLRLVLLWFGTWKNSMSCYAPEWVKTNLRRFPRARTKEGLAEEILTPFSEENRNTDARAFAALMKHVRSIDNKCHTILMVQVENEIGMIPDARDYCDKANVAFAEQVPSELTAYLEQHRASLAPELRQLWTDAGAKLSGTWEEVFGKSLQTDELFMAWRFAKYTDHVAAAGKKEYPLPMYVNAALIRSGYLPGQYPSAGPLPHLFDIWKLAAPAIDMMSPDIYFKNFAEWCGKYDRSGNPLFIPEADKDQGITNALYAFAEHHAIGYSPFSIESLTEHEILRISDGYAVVRQLEPLILDHRDKGTMAGVLLDSVGQTKNVQFGKYVLTCRHEYSWKYATRSGTETPRVGGMIIQISTDEFVVAGNGILVTFASTASDGASVGIACMEEGKYENGLWIAGRRMNGDQDHQGRHMHLPGGSFGIQKVKLYTYK